MSRCYPYPPPGYEKKAQVELGLSPKKEKHKHRDKKKKHKRDSETNGDVHDKDKRSNKIQRTDLASEVLCLENGKVPEIKAVSCVPARESTLQRIERVQLGSSRSERPLDGASCEPALYNNEREANGKLDSEPPLILARSTGNSNGAVASDQTPSSRHNSENVNDLNRQRQTQYIPQIEGVWSAIDDQEWLFLHNNHLRSKPRTKVEDDGTSQVLAEALLLPSVDIYALPYVVPY